MQGLMHLCRNLGTSDCQSIFTDITYPRDIPEGGDKPNWHDRGEREQFDSICRTCLKRNFLIDENRCLICDREELQPAPLSQIKYTSGTEYLYECPDCGTSYYSFQELL